MLEQHVFGCHNREADPDLVPASECSYCRTWRAAIEWAGNLHDSVSPSCDHEPEGAGAGAMGAVIAYRDLIRTERCSECGRATGGCCTVRVTDKVQVTCTSCGCALITPAYQCPSCEDEEDFNES